MEFDPVIIRTAIPKSRGPRWPFQQKSAAVEDWHHQIEENQLRQDPARSKDLQGLASIFRV
jgi:hypothetical protein